MTFATNFGMATLVTYHECIYVLDGFWYFSLQTTAILPHAQKIAVLYRFVSGSGEVHVCRLQWRIVLHHLLVRSLRRVVFICF